MTDVFVIRNQHGHYWGKSRAWISGEEPKAVMRARHEDEAVNTLFELSTRDVELRGQVLAVPLSGKGEPEIEPSQVPLPELRPAAAEPAAAPAVEPAAETTGERT